MDITEIKVGSVIELEYHDGSMMRIVITSIEGLIISCRSIAVGAAGEWHSRVGRVGAWNLGSKNIKNATIIGNEETRVR